MIKQVQAIDFERCLLVIQESFSTVAKEFNLTKENCPNHTSFIDIQRLEYHWNNGFLMFGYYLENNIIGYVSLSKKNDTEYELNNLAILPDYRNCGYGKEMIDYCKDKVEKLGGNKISIGIIDESSKLKSWYMQNGFVHIGVKKFEHLPFTVGFMELRV